MLQPVKWLRALLGAILVASAAMLANPAYAAASNDNIASAFDLGTAANFTISGDTTGATKENGEPNIGGSQHTIWYKWTAPATKSVQINTLNRAVGLDFILAVYTAQNPAAPAVNKLNGVNSGFDVVAFDAMLNTVYFIQVDSSGSDGAVNLNLPPPPANDTLASASDLGSVASFAISGTTVGATTEAGESFNGNGTTVWYKWTAPTTTQVRVNTNGSTTGVELAIATSTATPPTQASLVLISAISGNSSIQLSVTQGTSYFFQVDSNNDPGAFLLTLPPPPANDAFANAIDLGSQSSFSVIADNSGATTETGEPAAIGDGATLWYKWTAPFTKKTQIDTFGSDVFSPVDLFTGATVGTLTPVVGVTTNGNDSKIFNAVTGQPYFIRVDNQGLGVIRLNLANPANDNFANAFALSGNQILNILGDTTNATKELNEPNHGNNAGGASVCYNWTATVSGGTTVTQSSVFAHGVSVNHSLAVYTGASAAALSLVPNGGQAGPAGNSSVSFSAVAGTTYAIALDGQNGAFGEFNLSLSTFPAPANDNFANAQLVSGSTFTVAGTTNGATLETNETTVGAGFTVWYKWVAPSAGNFVIGATGTGFNNSFFDVYTGSTLNSLLRIASAQKTLLFTAVAGTTYLIRVDAQSANNSADFQMTLGPIPPNDNFSKATVLTGAAFDVFGYNFGATRESGEPAATGSNTVWWTWTAPANAHVSVNTTGSDFTTRVLKVFTGSAVSALTAVNFAAPPSNTTSATFDAVQGTVYSFSVGGGPGNIELALSNAPANDNFANSVALSGPDVSISGNNYAATKETGEPNHNGGLGGQSVWYSWTAPATAFVSIKVNATGSNTGFAPFYGVYTGTAVNALSTVTSGTGNIFFAATAGTVYRIAIDGNTTGTFDLAIEQFPPNDNLANAFPITGYSTVTGTSNNASKEPGEPSHGGDPGGASVWWSFVAPDTRLVEVTTLGSNFDTLLAVYTGTQVGALNLVAGNDNLGVNQQASKLQFNAVAGTTYYFAVDGSGGASGLVSLTVRRADVKITSPLTVSPDPQVATKPVTFTVGTDAPATFVWDFGDGTTETNTSTTITHVYAVAGNYTVVVTAMEDSGFSVSSNLAIVVFASRDLGLAKLGIVEDFTKPGKDTISASGFISLPPGGSLSGPLTIRIAGVVQTLQVANGVTKTKTTSLKITPSKTGGPGKFTFKIVGSYQTALIAAGFDKPIVKSKPVDVLLELDFNNVSYQFRITELYTSTGKKGSAK